MGKRSFICRSSLGGESSLHVYTTFLSYWLFVVVLCWCFDLWGYCVCAKICFFFLKMVYVWQIASHLKFTFPDHFDINMTLSWLKSLFMLIFCYIFGLKTCEEDALLVKYLPCTMCIFVRNTGKHEMCSGQTSDIVWCYIFRSYCSFKQHGEWNSTAVLIFLFYILHLTDNYPKMQMIFFIAYSWTFLSL